MTRSVFRVIRTIRRSSGVLRSLVMYYGIPFRGRRLRRFYRHFVGPGSLFFDIGANVGNRTLAARRIGARVISIEPQPHLAALLRQLFKGSEGVTVIEAAVGAHSGTVDLILNERHPTLATTRADWIESVQSSERFRAERWDKSIPVQQMTLDSLVDRFGVPDFAKIDVEGNEEGVLAGLSSPLPALSFEFIPALPARSTRCIKTLSQLDYYRFNYSLVERMEFVSDRWLGADEMIDILESMPPDGHSGDVYAVRTMSFSDSPSLA